jgi:hypothetical protein
MSEHMKNTKVSLTILSVLVGGMLAASAETTTYHAYSLSPDYTNAEAKIWSVSGGPQNPPDAIYPQLEYRGGSVDADSSGKITGVGRWTVTYSASGTPSSTFYGTVSGKLAGKIGSPATVTMTIKGDGYTLNGTGFATPFKANLKFTGQVGISPVNLNVQRMVGTLSGSFSGSTVMGAKGFKVSPGRVAYIPGSDFDYAGSRNYNISVDVLQSSKGKMQLLGTSLQGSGSIKDKTTYRATIKGVGSNKGVFVSLSGNVGLYTGTVASNTIPFLAPVTAEILKGSKWNGQEIQGVAPPPITVHLID